MRIADMITLGQLCSLMDPDNIPQVNIVVISHHIINRVGDVLVIMKMCNDIYAKIPFLFLVSVHSREKTQFFFWRRNFPVAGCSSCLISYVALVLGLKNSTDSMIFVNLLIPGSPFIIVCKGKKLQTPSILLKF